MKIINRSASTVFSRIQFKKPEKLEKVLQSNFNEIQNAVLAELEENAKKGDLNIVIKPYKFSNRNPQMSGITITVKKNFSFLKKLFHYFTYTEFYKYKEHINFSFVQEGQRTNQLIQRTKELQKTLNWIEKHLRSKYFHIKN